MSLNIIETFEIWSDDIDISKDETLWLIEATRGMWFEFLPIISLKYQNKQQTKDDVLGVQFFFILFFFFLLNMNRKSCEWNDIDVKYWRLYIFIFHMRIFPWVLRLIEYTFVLCFSCFYIKKNCTSRVSRQKRINVISTFMFSIKNQNPYKHFNDNELNKHFSELF